MEAERQAIGSPVAGEEFVCSEHERSKPAELLTGRRAKGTSVLPLFSFICGEGKVPISPID
jgi:hypothetical protein